MPQKSIHIVAFNNPYPANFGGAIDMFYKIKALHHIGVAVILHIFYDDRNDISGLEDYCETIYLYKRHRGIINHFYLTPFTVKSRENKELVKRLKTIKAPILFESLRSCSLLKTEVFSQKVATRNHNIEYKYSWGLANSESNRFIKLAHYLEGFKQKRFENILNSVDVLFNISNAEHIYFEKNYKPKSVFLPVFQGHDSVKSKSGFGKYAFYHGDLTTADNIRSALFLVKVFSNTKFPFVIAGSELPKKLETKIKGFQNISFVRIKDQKHLIELVENAHVNTLYSFQRSGTKLKVFTALYNGRHCLLNTNMVDDKEILNCCYVAEKETEYQDVLNTLFNTEYLVSEQRKTALARYNDIKNAELIVKKLF